MINSINYLSLIGLFCLSLMASAENSLSITTQGGAERNIELSSLGKITFQSSELVVHFRNGNTEIFPLTAIQKMAFAEISGLNQSVKAAAFSVYPNPATSFIILENAPADAWIHIYSISGVLMKSCQMQASSGQVDISELPIGFYVLKLNNQAYKFSKK